MNVHLRDALRLQTKSAGGAPQEGGDDALALAFEQHHQAVEAALRKSGESESEIKARLVEIEQRLARRSYDGDDDLPVLTSPGRAVTRSDAFKAFGGSRQRGKVSIEVKNIITTAVDSAGGMMTTDRRTDPVLLARQRITVRDLLAPGNTNANSVQYARQTLRENNVQTVAEGARKPESNYAFELKDAPVRTLAHWTKASRQALDDAPMLQSVIDGELRFGLQLKEEAQLLFGDGTGQNLFGIVPQATAYDAARNGAGDTAFDTVAHALAQAEAALLPATGIVLNTDDLEAMKVIKDSEGRYIGGGPFGPPIVNLWGRPVVGTPTMPQGEFLVGAFRDGAQIFDRWDATVLISTENEDDFVRNLCTILAEERLALAVKRPNAFIVGTFPAAA